MKNIELLHLNALTFIIYGVRFITFNVQVVMSYIICGNTFTTYRGDIYHLIEMKIVERGKNFVNVNVNNIP